MSTMARMREAALFHVGALQTLPTHPLCNLREAESWDCIPGTLHLSLKLRLESFWALLHLLRGQT